ncbi:Fanconi anemia group J protein homolog isoform X2 [Fopius arisanus]|uniref:Fanconi anemia group J protein homolog isoform X2 n=2 Tax=Fopius arisanus TaxID=64838 RepID=A0A9R1U320_9HYME|nr:PREDICTED: Fanconi anemia group J protein homolog isoform X2 [Fopius arisanus]
MELVELTSDDDSFESPVLLPKPSTAKGSSKSRKKTTEQHFIEIMTSSEESDGGTSEDFKPTFVGKENMPIIKSTSSPKIIGLGPEDSAPSDASLQTNHSEGIEVPANLQGQAYSKPAPRRFFRWGSGEEESSSMFKKRPLTSPSVNEAKRRNIEFYDVDNADSISNPLASSDGCCDVDPPVPIVTRHHRLEIAGVKVDFPLNPYPAQKAVMNALIKGCRNEEHSLIESPTGSGKTLALLCGALAWQGQYAEDYKVQMAAYMRSMESSMLTGENSAGEAGKIPGEKNDVNKKDGADSTSPPPPPVKLPKRPPKIYYGSRTHRQISQVTKELRRTIYRETKMTILSSRDFTCIQQGNRNKTELCNEFMDPLKKARCPYYNENNKQEISHYDALNHMGFPMPFDIEDMVNLGNERGCCPYFAARNLMVEADLILCPYNYLIDPSIRKVMQINLQDAIIILDEAHNIEDICRASASTSFTIEELDAVIDDCSEFHKHCTSVYDKEPDFVEVCYYFCSKLKNLIETRPDLKKRDSKSNSAVYSPIWNGSEFQQILELHGISFAITKRFLIAVTEAGEHQNKVRDDLAAGAPIGVTLSMATMRILEKYQYPFQMFRCSEKRDDFRVFVKEATEWLPSSKSGVHPETVRTLECLCMNPGVVFSPLAESARSIILASGTLSPIISFASELGTTFKQILQNKHVIPKENVHIRVIPKGPQGIAIKATYDNTSQWKVQDEIGRVIVDACESVPFGVLCFLPSYALLNTIFTRMTENGTMSRIRKIKVVFTEPKRNAELDEVMRDYREAKWLRELTSVTMRQELSSRLVFPMLFILILQSTSRLSIMIRISRSN